MKKIISYCFDNWWRPVLFFGLTALLFVLSEYFGPRKIQDFFSIIFGLGFLGLLISTVYQLVRKRWRYAVFTTLFIAVSIVGFFFLSIALFWKIQSEPDTYADELKIPTNIQINQPNEQTEPSKIKETDFFINSSFQPGLYTYAVWTRRIEKGKIYLKAFEVTENEPLSVDRLKERSIIEVYNPTDSIVKSSMKNETEFTIYEGDWGKPYAARFELWFKPDNGGKERKLLEKNYEIEGWQR